MKRTSSASSVTSTSKIDRQYLENYLREHLGDRYDQAKVDRGDDSARMWYWGESMYGGYYAEVWVISYLLGIHEEKLSDLRKRVAELGLKLNRDHRWDH